MKDIQLLVKKNNQEGRHNNIYPKTYTGAIKDKNSGRYLDDILLRFNMYFLVYNGSIESTRLQVPSNLRRTGLWITYVRYDGSIGIEYYLGDNISDEYWKNTKYWRSGTNLLVGSLSISAEGNWIIDGKETNYPARGEKGITPLLRVDENKEYQVSYDEGIRWTNLGTRFYSPDEEDITEDENKALKLKDRNSTDGMGYVILRKNKSFAEQVTLENTIYEIRYNFDLKGAEVTIPNNCTLNFLGGSINNGIITTHNTIIINLKLFCSTSLLYKGNLRGSYIVSYDMFGAKLDGISSDYSYIKKCHEFANTYNISVVQNYGIINIDGNYQNLRIIVKTNTDISNCILIITDNTNGDNGYYILDDNEFEDFSTIIRNNKTEFSLGTTRINSLSLNIYDEKLYIANGTRTLGARPHGDSVLPYYNLECFTILTNGVFRCAPLYCDFTEDLDSVDDKVLSLKGKSIHTTPLIFKAPILRFNKSQYTSPWYSGLFYIDRNNITLILPQDILIDNFPDIETSIVNPSIFIVENAYNVYITGGINKNMGYLIGQTLKDSCYIIRFTNCDNIIIDKVCLFRGWGAMNTEFCKDIHITDSTLNRFDNHFGLGNLSIDNTTIVGNNNFVNIGYGDGNVVISNSKWICEDTSTVNNYSFITLRKDLRISYRGLIVINNCYIKANTSTLTLISEQDLWSRPTLTYFTDISTKCINIDNLYIDDNSLIDNIILLKYTSTSSSLNRTIEDISFGGITSKFFGTFFDKSEDSIADNPLNINKLNIKHCLLPNIECGSLFPNIENLTVINSNIYSALDFTNKIKLINAIYSKVAFRNTYIDNKIIYVGCEIAPSDITGTIYLLVKIRNALFIACKFISRNNLTKISVDTSSSTKNTLIIGCTLDDNITVLYSEMKQTLKYYRGDDLNIEEVTISDPGSNNLTFFSTKYLCPVFCYNNRWYKMDGTKVSIPKIGPSTSRPSDIIDGYLYFDTTLNKPIYWISTKWVDANGQDA